MRVVLILLGLLLMIGGAAVAGAQYAPPDLLKMLDAVPEQAREFLRTPSALYAGAGGAGVGLLLMIIGMATGGKKKSAKANQGASDTPYPPETKPATAPHKPAEPSPAPVIQPTVASPLSGAAPAARSPAEPPKPKPQASAQPPASASTGNSLAEAARANPRLHNRKRVSDLVTINDALQAYFRKHGAYPAAAGLAGVAERGVAWIPGLTPEFLPELPLDPAMAVNGNGPQYVYTSDGKDYKLLALNVSLVGGTSVEVLGVKVDRSRQPTMENASFGFWTPGFEAA